MAWSYFCAMDNMTLTGNTKEELAQKMQQHMKETHDQEISMDQAMEMVNKNAQQAA
ncbi:MAG: DUF1059 domain-containing protein [Armatimonadota bacterium]